jgi:hypothetical protein
MAETISRAQSTEAAFDPVVILFAPESFGGVDFKALKATVRGGEEPARVLVYLVNSTPAQYIDGFKEAGIETEWLLGPNVQPVELERFTQMPIGSRVAEQEDLALAMTDVVMAASSADSLSLLAKARAFEKPCILPGERLPLFPRPAGIAHNLGPDSPGYFLGERFFGRFEQILLELLAFSWLGWRKGGVRESRKRIWKACKLSWAPAAYFAPDDWKQLLPERESSVQPPPVWVKFDELDRCALYGSYIHRDLIWAVHLFAAFAVFAAVAGEIWKSGVWNIIELGALLFVAFLVAFAQLTQLQDRWTACRLGAEQLRIARMCLPLLVVPSALRSVDKRIIRDPAAKRSLRRFFSHKNPKPLDYTLLALAEVKEVVRLQGLPALRSTSYEDGVKWLKLIVDDQTTYHRRNHIKLEFAEQRLLLIQTILFVLAMGAVIAHFFDFDWDGLLLFTASGPAFAAAFHGAGTRLGIVHRNALSETAEKELEAIQAQLEHISNNPLPPEEGWAEVRRLASDAADAMGRENTSWHGLVRRERDGLPA